MRLALTLVLFWALVAAGCMGASTSKAAPTSSSAPPIDSDLGSLAGLVVDDEQVPLAGADVVVLSEPAVEAISDAQGRFRAADVPPGEHLVRATLAGHRSAESRVLIRAGEAASATLVLVAIAQPVPHISSYIAEAIIELGVNVMGIYHYDNTSGTQYRDIFFPLDWQAHTIVVGTEWTATSAASAKMMQLSTFLSTPQCEVWCKLVAQSEGRSPLQGRVDDVETAREGRGNLTINPYLAIAPACVVATVDKCASQPDAVAQAAQDQRFKVYASVFYVAAAPPAFSPFPSD